MAESDVSWSSGGDDLLSPPAERAAAVAFAATVPPGASPFSGQAFLEAVGAAEPPSAEPAHAADPRWAAFFGHPLFASVWQWIGARVLADRGAADALGPAHDTADLVSRLEARFNGALRRALSSFWGNPDAQRRARSDPLSVDLVALEWTLMTAIGFLHMQMSRIEGARAFVRQLVALWRRAGVPGEDRCPVNPRGLDDWLLWQHRLSAFWIATVFEMTMASTTRTAAVFDPAAEFPSAPFLFPGDAYLSLAPPGRRPPNGPIPNELLDRAPPFRCGHFFGWLDPLERTRVSPDRREAVLQHSIGTMDRTGSLYAGFLVFFALQKIAEYSTWLRSDAGLALLDVLVAEEVLRQTGEGAAPSAAARALDVDDAYVESLLANEMLAEAMRRRQFLEEGADLLQSALPPAVADPWTRGDAGGVMAALAGLPDMAREQLFGILVVLQLVVMLPVCPDLFENPLEQASGLLAAPGPAAPGSHSDLSASNSSGTATSDSSTLPANADAWFLTPSFAAANRAAIGISSLSRSLAALPRPPSPPSYLAAFFSSLAAIHAAWVHVLVLRRFKVLIAAAPTAEQARALELHAAITSDARACLAVLESSGLPQYRPAHALLTRLLASPDARLGPAEVQLLRSARRGAGTCPHSGALHVEGACYLCATERIRGGESLVSSKGTASEVSSGGTEEGDAHESDPLVAIPQPGTSKRVRFDARVLVHETWGRDEYQARSLRAPDPDEEGAAHGAKEAPLSVLLGQRKDALPDLKAFW
ncbi:hypothetical protein DFJ74DRAFT_736145 [Hyaloraphidium curvatum]|nr:hypothetical protein DFJ74DRAFT_736145 [Hyaloraphidium curvatum]